MIKVDIEDKDLGLDELKKRLQADAVAVDIGIQKDEEKTLIIIAAAHEFGATINHPGGTNYGFKTANDEKKRKITFLKAGQGFKVLGTTKPHIIKIPMRSYIRSTIDANQETYHRIAKDLVTKIVYEGMTKFKALSLMGQKIQADIKRTIVTLKSPPLAKSTIRAKGSTNPLIDKGTLLNSVRFVVINKNEAA